jgi:signal transduction histidine kinase
MPNVVNEPVPAAVAAAQNAGRAVALVVDGLVHDLNNPLTTVLANLEMLSRRVRAGAALDDDDREALEETLQASVRVAALLREARAVSRGAAGRARIDVVLRAAIRATKQVARDRNIRPLLHEPPIEGSAGVEGGGGDDDEVLVRGEEPRLALALTLLADAVLRRMPGGAGSAVTFGGRVDGDDVVVEVVVVGTIDVAVEGDDAFAVARAAIGDTGTLLVTPLENGLVLSLRLPRDPGNVSVPPGILR